MHEPEFDLDLNSDMTDYPNFKSDMNFMTVPDFFGSNELE